MSSKNQERKTKKKIIKKKKKIKENLLQKYTEDYSQLNDSNLLKKSESIVGQLTRLKDLSEEQIEELEIQLEAIKYIIDEKSQDTSFDDSDYKYYPDFDDKDFNKKIFLKKEFNLNKIPFIEIPKKSGFLDIENISNKMCVRNQDNPDMTLNPNQNFLKRSSLFF